MITAAIGTGLVQATQHYEQRQWPETDAKLRRRLPKLPELTYDAEHDVLTYMAFPKEHRSQIASPAPLEPVNKEVMRRLLAGNIFSNDTTHRPPGQRVDERADREVAI